MTSIGSLNRILLIIYKKGFIIFGQNVEISTIVPAQKTSLSALHSQSAVAAWYAMHTYTQFFLIKIKIFISAYEPKFDNNFFGDLCVLYKFWAWNCSTLFVKSKSKHFHIRKLYKKRKSSLSWSSKFGLIKKLHMPVLFQLYAEYKG